jgi:hypothetical protein
MLLPQSLSFLFTCCRAVAEVMAVSTSPTFDVFEIFALEGSVGVLSVLALFCLMDIVGVGSQGEFKRLKVALNFGCVGVQVAVSVDVALTLRVCCLYFSVQCMARGHRCDEKFEEQHGDFVFIVRSGGVSCVSKDAFVVIA